MSEVCRYVLHGPVRCGDDRVVVVLTAVFDESGSHDGARYVTIAGYAATVVGWEKFSVRWVQALRDARVPMHKPPLPGDPPTPFFHMTDWENRQEQFKDWDDKRRVKLFQRLASLIDQYTLLGFGVSVEREGYARIIAPMVPERSGYRDPYMWAMHACMENLYYAKSPAGVLGVHIVDQHPIACVFERGHASGGRIAAYHEQFREQWKAGHVFGALALDTKRRFVPLQSADVLAYESWKSIQNRGVRPRRKTLERLLKRGRIMHLFQTADDLTRIATRIRSMTSGHPEDVLDLIVAAPRPDRPNWRRN